MSGATISVNAKTAGGTLVSVGGVGYDDFHANLLGLYEGDAVAVGEVLAAMRSTVTPLSGGGSAPAVPAAVAAAFPQAAPVQPAAPAQQAPSCHHGVKQFRSGEKNGRQWKAYFCPSPKGTPDQCPAEFVR